MDRILDKDPDFCDLMWLPGGNGAITHLVDAVRAINTEPSRRVDVAVAFVPQSPNEGMLFSAEGLLIEAWAEKWPEVILSHLSSVSAGLAGAMHYDALRLDNKGLRQGLNEVLSVARENRWKGWVVVIGACYPHFCVQVHTTHGEIVGANLTREVDEIIAVVQARVENGQ